MKEGERDGRKEGKDCTKYEGEESQDGKEQRSETQEEGLKERKK